MPLGHILVRVISTAISGQVTKGERAKVLTSLAVGALGVPILVFCFVRDVDGDVVWGWVFAAFIGGAIAGALVGSTIGPAGRKPPQA